MGIPASPMAIGGYFRHWQRFFSVLAVLALLPVVLLSE